MNKINFIAAFILSLVSFSCASNKQSTKPLWADDATINQVYPNELYIARIGTSQDEDKSLLFADAELSSYFSRQVSSEIKAVKVLTNKNGVTSDESTITQNVSSKSYVQLFNVAHTTPWYDKSVKKYVCCAYINRAEAWRMYESNVIQAKQTFYSIFNKANDEKDLLKKSVLLVKCKNAANEYVVTLDTGRVLYSSGVAKYEGDRDVLSSIDQQIISAKLNSIMKVSVKNDSYNKISYVVTSILRNQGYEVSDTNYLYLVTVVVKPNKVTHKDTHSITAEPGITLTINNRQETVFAYAKTTEHVTGYSDAEKFVNNKIYSALEKELNSSLSDELNKSFN